MATTQTLPDAPASETSAGRFRVRVADKDAKAFLRGFLKARAPKDVKRDGYAFTTSEHEAWSFDSQAQAEQKRGILDRHFSYSVTFEVVPVGGEVAA